MRRGFRDCNNCTSPRATLEPMVEIVGIAGSLRRGSWNAALLRAATESAPAGCRIVAAGLGGIPLYDGDLEAESGLPAPVLALQQLITAADGLLIVTPEYNHSIPGVLKNALDWASRGSDSPLNDKVAAVMGAGGRFGTARAQLHLRENLIHNRVLVLPREFLVSRAGEQFDDQLRLKDDEMAQRLLRHVTELASLARRVQPASV